MELRNIKLQNTVNEHITHKHGVKYTLDVV